MSTASAFKIRPMTDGDFRAVAEIIAQVKKQEFRAGEAPEILVSETVTSLRVATKVPRGAWFVAEMVAKVVGSAAVAASKELAISTCELQYVFLLPEARGLGIGEALVRQCLESGRDLDYRHCYLETLGAMTAAQAVYRKCGFKSLPQPLKASTPDYLEHWMLIDL